MKPLAVSLFSGAGGLDRGLAKAGFDVRVQVEKDKWCVESLKANRTAFGRKVTIIHEDIQRLSPRKILAAAGVRKRAVALLAGGPPCESFSYAGLRKGLTDSRGALVGEFVRMLEGLQPESFLFENVPGFADIPIHGPEGVEPLVAWFIQKCVEAGYSVCWGVVDVADYGVPQHRERFIALGCKHDCIPVFPLPTHGPRGQRPCATLRTALAELNEEKCGLGWVMFSEKYRKILDHVPPGGNWRDLSDEVMEQAMGGAIDDLGGKTGWWRRLSWDKPSPTIVAKPDHRGTCLCHPATTRPLTIRECARIQSFPDSWVIEGPIRARYRQVGDAVPVKFAEALGRTLRAHLEGKKRARLEGWPVVFALRLGPSNRRVGLWGWASKKGVVYIHVPRPRRAREIARAEGQMLIRSAV